MDNILNVIPLAILSAIFVICACVLALNEVHFWGIAFFLAGSFFALLTFATINYDKIKKNKDDSR